MVRFLGFHRTTPPPVKNVGDAEAQDDQPYASANEDDPVPRHASLYLKARLAWALNDPWRSTQPQSFAHILMISFTPVCRPTLTIVHPPYSIELDPHPLKLTTDDN
jgi:hypothetical protein